MNFYTNVVQNRGKMLLRGIDENGRPFKQKIDYKPYLFVNGHGDSEYRTIHDEPVHRIDFDSIHEAKEYVKLYDGVDGHIIHGMTNYMYPFLFDTYQGEIEYDPEKISVVSLDIENKIVKEGFVHAVRYTPEPITAITLTRNGKVTSFGYKDYTPHADNITYIRCKDEMEMLDRFLDVWNSPEFSPDVITGWNIEFYDIPYLIGRITRVLGEHRVKDISPWKLINTRKTEIKGEETTVYIIEGISTLDYLDLYKNFTYIKRESYSLDFICDIELNEKKLDYSEYKSLDEMYEMNFQKYLEYNIRDAELVLKLENELGLIQLVFAVAYDAKVNFSDAMTTVKLWDVIIHNYLLEQNIVVPPTKHGAKSSIVGGYVKEPIPGMYKWVASFDLNSLYPHLIQHYNISPEMFVGMTSVPDIDDIIENNRYVDTNGYSVTANGCMFRRDKKGFLAAVSEKGYSDRDLFKSKMKEAKIEYEKTKDEKYRKEMIRWDKKQHAKKIQLNSLYGALANAAFRWFELKFAEAITMSGQLAIKWVTRDINAFMNKSLGTNNIDYAIANDTDSSYLTLEALVNKFLPDVTDTNKIVVLLSKLCQDRIQKVIEESFVNLSNHMNSYQQKMKMKLECIADRGIWVAKKRYILNVYYDEGVIYNEPKLKVTGIEAVRSSTPRSCRDSIKEALKIVLNKHETDFHEYIADFRSKFFEMEFQDIAFPRSISDVTKYTSATGDFIKGTPIHVRGSILHNKIVKTKGIDNVDMIGNGDKIKFCYMKLPNPYNSNIIAASDELPESFGLNEYLDYETQFQKAYLDPLENIVKHIGWNTEKKFSLDDFFS